MESKSARSIAQRVIFLSYHSTLVTPAPSHLISLFALYCYDDIDLETHQLGRKLRGPIELPLRISILGGDVLSFYVATLA